jgi:hypothetical protein
MVRSFRLSLITVLCSLTLAIGASAPLAPEYIKSQVESAVAYSIYITDKVVREILEHNSVDTLFGTYSVETIFSWNNGTTFIKSLQRSTDENIKVKLSSAFKIYVQKQLKAVWLDDIFTTTTPSTLHAINDYETSDRIASDLGTTQSYKQHLKQIAPLLCTLIKEEKDLNDKGYVVFFHSQRWEYLFGEKLYTDLWALTNNKKRPNSYLFPHVRIEGLDPEAAGKLSRTKILKEGYSWASGGTLLFATNSLFGNYKDEPYRSALSYFLRNDNEGHVKFERKDIFTHYKLSYLYTKYAQEIAALETYYDAARTFGTMLRIAIPKTMIRDYCFRTWGGSLRSPEIDIYTFLEDLKTKPQKNLNNEEFCIVMLDEAMDPEGRILIKAYHCAEQTEYKKFEIGYEKLIQKLTAEINPPAVPTKKSPAAPIKKVGKKR